MKVSRHVAREFAMQTLFAWLFLKREKSCMDIFHVLQHSFFEQDAQDLKFCSEIIQGVEKNFMVITKTIETFAPNWPFEKISLVDAAILCVGVYEILYNKEIPHVVAINESIEIAKKFGDEASSKFVNGVLHSLMTSQKNA